MRIDPLARESQNSTRIAIEFKEEGPVWFLPLAWYKRELMKIIPKHFFCSHWHTYRHFCLSCSKRSWPANSFPLRTLSCYNMNDTLIRCETYHMSREGKQKRLSQRENMRELWLWSYRTCPTHELTAWNYYHICYCCFSCYSFLLLASIWKLHYLQRIFCWYLTWLDYKYLSWLKTILWVLEDHLHLKVVLKKEDTSLRIYFLLNFLSEKTNPQLGARGILIRILVSILHEFQKVP